MDLCISTKRRSRPPSLLPNLPETQGSFVKVGNIFRSCLYPVGPTYCCQRCSASQGPEIEAGKKAGSEQQSMRDEKTKTQCRVPLCAVGSVKAVKKLHHRLRFLGGERVSSEV